MASKIEELERKVWRIEKLIWYVAAMISARAGYDLIPLVEALMN